MRAAALVALAACWSAAAPPVKPAPHAALIHHHWPPPRPLPELPIRGPRRAPIPMVVFSVGPPLAIREPAADELEQMRRDVKTARGRARVAALDRLTAALEAIADTWTDPVTIDDSVAAYRDLLAERAIEAVPQGDELIYRAARALHYGHDDAAAAAAFQRMIAAFPRSLYAGDAAAAAADAVAAIDPDRARRLYAQAIANGRPTAADYARYQLILFHTARGEPAEALASCVELATHGGNADLREIGARLAVKPYADVNAGSGAYVWFQQLAPAIARELVEAAAEIYLAIGKPGEAIAALDDLPHPGCYDLVLGLRAARELGSDADVLAAAEHVARAAEGCADADEELGALAWAWQGRRDADPLRVARMWQLALAVATTPERRAAEARDLAQLRWQLAERDPVAWPAAADALEAAAQAAGGDPALAAAAADARANATRR